MTSHCRVLAYSSLGLLTLAAALSTACGSEDSKKKTPRVADEASAGEGGDGGAAPGVEPKPEMGGAGGDSNDMSLAGKPQGGEPGSPLPTALREILGLPAALQLPVVCGAPSAGLSLSVLNTSQAAVTIEAVTLEGPFELKTKLPLTIEPGKPQSVEISTAPGVVGTDKPGDEREGSVSVTTNLGQVRVALTGIVQGSTLSVDSIPGAPLTGAVTFSCVSTGPDTCPTRSFHIVNTGESPVKLGAPVGKNDVVAAFVPGNTELTLQPGAAVKLDVRAAAGGGAAAPSADLLKVSVEGSCEVNSLEIATKVLAGDDCSCNQAPPGLEVGTLDETHSCSDDSPIKLPLFNGTAKDITLTQAAGETIHVVDDQLPLLLPAGKTTWLGIVPPNDHYPGESLSLDLYLNTDRGSLYPRGQITPSGSLLRLNDGETEFSQNIVLNCGAQGVQLYNYGDVAVTVMPPVVTGIVETDFTDAQVIEPNSGYEFFISTATGKPNCGSTGTLEFTDLSNSCDGSNKLHYDASYIGTGSSCGCNL